MKRKGGGSERAEVDEENMDLESEREEDVLEENMELRMFWRIREQDREGLC